MNDLCGDCPPVDYPTDKTRCDACPRRALDFASELRANAKETHMTIGGRPFAIEAANAIVALTEEVGLYRSRWLSCITPEEATRLREEAAKLKAALKEIGQWSVEILNADRGAVHHELREFAGDCYGQVTDALGGQP